MNKKHKSISYAKWGYIFIIPFFVVYIIFSLIPTLSTFYYSFFDKGFDPVSFEEYEQFVGFDNYAKLMSFEGGTNRFLTYFGNTMIMWVLGAVPQLLFSLLLAVIFTSARLKIKGQRFFKTVIYMPNLIMAASYAMLFIGLFSDIGPINVLIKAISGDTFRFLADPWGARGVIAFVNFIMWFGNTTILLMAGIMGIDQSLFEAAQIDGASGMQVFTKITLPLLMPILVYVAITSLIGGLQMFDVPQIMRISETPTQDTTTMIMWLNNLITGASRQYGLGGAMSVLIFIVTGGLSLLVFKTMVTSPDKVKSKKKAK